MTVTLTQPITSVVSVPTPTGVRLRITQPVSSVVSVVSQGPQGPQGPKGDTGDSFASMPAQANQFFAGPASGDPDLPSFRRIEGQDVGGIIIDGGNF